MPIVRLYDRRFFKRWSREMAYILGFLYADGNIVVSKRGTHFISIYTADKHLLGNMRKCVKSTHKISRKASPTGGAYRIQIGSKEWFTDITKFGLIPNKAKRLKLPHIPKKYFGDFVRGYFDGDGNVWMGYLHKHRRIPTKVIQVAFTSVSLDFLKALHFQLKNFGIQGGGYHTSKRGNYSRLNFSSYDTLKLYKIMYTVPHKLFLNRKKQVFERFMRE